MDRQVNFWGKNSKVKKLQVAKINRNKVTAIEETEESRLLAGPLFRRYKA